MLVFDRNRFGSKREIDPNGYLRVSACNITKTQVRIYYGKEIPGWKDFNLDPDKIYNVYCPAEELKKALETFNNLPLTREHIEVNVNNVPKDKIVGSLGDSAQFKSPYVQNSIIVYDQKDIDWIMSGRKRELSCGYTYTPVQQSGEFNGLPYDFIMTEIVGNHVALVKEGRAGHDVMVADENIVCDYNEYHDDEGRFCCSDDASVSSKISFIVKKAKEVDTSDDLVRIGAVSDKLVEEASKNGMDISGYEHSIDISAVKHIMNEHGIPSKEDSRGQIAITEEDFQLIPQIIESADKIEFGELNNKGLQTIKYTKVFDDGTVYYVEEKRSPKREHKLLTTNTMYKNKSGQVTADSKKATVLIRPEPLPDNCIIAQDFDAVKNNFDGGVTSQSLSLDNQQHLRSDNPREDILTQDSENVNSESEFNPNFTENENNNKLLDKGEESMVNDEFKEADHPRDKDGKFTSAGSGSSTGGSGSIEHNGAKIDIKKDGKYAYVRIYAPEGKKFKNGDIFYTTEAEADKAEELAKKIIENEFGGEGEKKEESSDLESIYSKALEKDPDDRTRNDFLRARYNDIQDLRKRYEAEKDPEEKKEKKADLEFAENQFRKMYGEDSEKKESSGNEIKKPNSNKSVKIVKNGDSYMASYGQRIKQGVPGEESPFQLLESKEFSSEKAAQKWANKVLELDSEMANDEIPAKAGKPEKAGEEEALNKGEEKMAEEVKEAIAEKVKEAKEEKVVEDACGKGKDAKGAKDEGIDKRKLIDEIGGILKGKLEEELWRTVMKKAEELAYNDSERSADDKKPVKDEAEKDLKGKEKEAFAEGVDFGEKKEKEEPKKLDSEHESEGTKKADEKEEKAEDKKEAKDKCTMDSQIVMDIDAIKAQVREEVMADFKARENARKAVRSVVGDVNVMAFDSAEEIYKFACEKAGMDLNEIVSFKDAFRGLSAAKSTKLALDASPISGSNEECFKGIRIA